MAKDSKRLRNVAKDIDPNKHYSISDAFSMVKTAATVKFDESIDVSVILGINARKSDQNVRGATVLPKGTGKTVRVAVFAEGENAELAKQAGADLVGFEDLAESVLKGTIDFDLCIATPDSMRVVGRLGQILGPRGLMPNPKVGTVTNDVTKAVNDAKAGQVQFRNDKGGIIHSPLGKASFNVDDLVENLNALVTALIRAKPATAKGQYIRRISVSSTMGPGVKIDRSSVVSIK